MKETKRVYRKLVIVGDGGCGKTCLLTVFCKGAFPEEYIPTVFESYVQDVFVNDTRVELALWDTAAQEDYDHIRPLSYPGSDICLVCFALDNVMSLNNVEERWSHELQKYSPNVPIILVGCKKDLKKDRDEKGITAKNIEKVRRSVGAVTYLECSALTGEGVRHVFDVAGSHTLSDQDMPEKDTTKTCMVL